MYALGRADLGLGSVSGIVPSADVHDPLPGIGVPSLHHMRRGSVRQLLHG